MTKEPQHSSDTLSADGLATLLRLLVTAPHARVSSAVIDGCTLWIKRYDVAEQPLAKGAHSVLSPLLPLYLRASPRVDSQGFIDREVRKMTAFRDAGFSVADIVFRNEKVLVLSETAEIVQQRLWRLRGVDEVAHDDLLVGMAGALASLHRAGLCHGRPHPRDMFAHGDHWGFIDFEEEPEAVMPLALAQARDVWLLFLQISGQALRADTKARAFDAYRSNAPDDALVALKDIARFFSAVSSPLRLAPVSMLGKDGRNILKGTGFLKAALDAVRTRAAEGDFAPATGHDGPRG
ncbi:lipopolysaccharide kinase InaA family protein [Borborobacter arsenicus]|uniref:lipopolysaccharide kinase InaA family protein n=1 Tax=Borborobacter arsenicus TaxID=1851146 RepID=UPI001AEC868B|nr:serine/threonine protein phosphatase [Pseudaminobacter arsenicus]